MWKKGCTDILEMVLRYHHKIYLSRLEQKNGERSDIALVGSSILLKVGLLEYNFSLDHITSLKGDFLINL